MFSKLTSKTSSDDKSKAALTLALEPDVLAVKVPVAVLTSKVTAILDSNVKPKLLIYKSNKLELESV